jgi:hypothetical protein
MKILNLARPQREPIEYDIPQMRDDPEFAAASEMLSVFNAHLERLQQEQTRLRLVEHFGSSKPGSDRPSDSHLRARLAELNKLAPVSGPIPEGPKAPTPAIAAALDVIRGVPVEQPPDMQAQMRAVEVRIDILSAARGEQLTILQQIKDRKTLEFSQMLSPQWNAMQLELYRAAQEFARVTDRVRAFRASINAAGIGSRSDLLLQPNVRAPLILGSESEWTSEISGWRRVLQTLRIIE